MSFKYYDVRGKFMEKLEPELLRLGMQIVRPAGRGFIVRIPIQAQLEDKIANLNKKFVRTTVAEVDNFNQRLDHSFYPRIISLSHLNQKVFLNTSVGELIYENIPDDVLEKAKKFAQADMIFETINALASSKHAAH